MKFSELKSIDEVFPGLDQAEYARWWLQTEATESDPVIQTLARHVVAFQDKILALPEDQRCACAYDHPDDICMTHKPACREPSCPDFGDPNFGEGTCQAEHGDVLDSPDIDYDEQVGTWLRRGNGFWIAPPRTPLPEMHVKPESPWFYVGEMPKGYDPPILRPSRKSA